MRHVRAGITAALYVTLVACAADSASLQQSTGMTAARLNLTDGQRRRLASRKIFFAHQSVGGNILQGVSDLLAADQRLPLRIVRSSTPATVEGPAFIESPIGRNGDPVSKADAFVAALEHGMGVDDGIALYKYCYLDFDASTDVRRVFAEHRAAVERVRAANPTLTVVHVTVPLTVAESPLVYFGKRLLGRPTVRAANAKRSEFNALMRKTFDGREPLFDLAAIESTRPDGTRTYDRMGSDTVYALATDYSDDGGHLNERGRRAAASELLSVLASIH